MPFSKTFPFLFLTFCGRFFQKCTSWWGWEGMWGASVFYSQNGLKTKACLFFCARWRGWTDVFVISRMEVVTCRMHDHIYLCPKRVNRGIGFSFVIIQSVLDEPISSQSMKSLEKGLILLSIDTFLGVKIVWVFLFLLTYQYLSKEHLLSRL